MSAAPNGAVDGYPRVESIVDIELAERNGGEEHEVGEKGEREPSKLIYAEQEIYNLLEIRGLPVTDFWKVAVEEWEKSAKQFGDRVEAKKKQVLDITNEIYQLVGFSCAFQGLLLTAAAQATNLACHNKFWVLTLSVFISFVTAAGVWSKIRIVSDLQKTIDTEDPTRRHYVNRIRKLKEYGPKSFELRRITQREEKCPRAPQARSCLKSFGAWFQKTICSYRCMVFLCLCKFGIICAVSMNQILCH